MTHHLLPSSLDHMLSLIREGASVADAAADIGVTGRTIYRRVKTDAALRDRLTEALRVRDAAKIKPHGRAGLYAKGCRCAPCTDAHRVYRNRLRAERRTTPLPATVEHGKAATYGNWGCRCQPCRAAHAVVMRRDYERRINGPIPDSVRHGSVSTYNSWGCRCEPCRDAAREAYRQRRAAS